MIKYQKVKELYGKMFKILELNKKSSLEKHLLLGKELSNLLSHEISPFYTHGEKLIPHLRKLDAYYTEHSSELSENCKRIYTIFNKTRGFSVSLLSITTLCNVINSMTDGSSVSITNLRMLLAKSLISSVSYTIYVEPKIDPITMKLVSFERTPIRNDIITLKKSEILELGQFLFDGLDYHFLDKKLKNKVSIQNSVLEILNVSMVKLFVHPSIMPYPDYIKGKDIYSAQIETHYKMYQGCTISPLFGKRSYESINYLQSQPFKIDEEKLNNILLNIESFFKEYVGNDSPDCLKYESISEIVLECKDNKIEINVQSEMIKNWHKSNMKLNLFLNTLCIAELYRKNTFYFRYFFDWRGRTYVDSYPLSPQADMLSRHLLYIETPEMVGIDVTGSGFQILGLLGGCEKTLERTKFFSTLEKNDIYEHNLYLLLEYMSRDASLLKYREIFDRKFYKNLIMCKIYSEGNFSRSKKIMERILEVKGEYTSMKQAMIISILINKLFEENNKILSDVEKDILDVANILCARGPAVSINFGCNEFIIAASSYPIQNTVKVNFVDVRTKKTKKVSLKMDKIPFENSKRKTLASIVPNFIHNLDAHILSLVIIKCKKENIPLYTVHDCFYVNSKYSHRVKRFYYDSCIKVVLTNPVGSLLSLNGVENSFIEEKYKDNIKKVMKMYANKEMSNEILR